jgi:hypothetical protein
LGSSPLQLFCSSPFGFGFSIIFSMSKRPFANSAIRLWLQSRRPAGRVAEPGSLATTHHL